jgi:soluble lytic murein transglycosylase-like protein
LKPGGPSALGRLVFVMVMTAGLAWILWQEYEEPVRAAVRDYLSYQRVEHYEDVLRVAALESEIDPCLLAAVMICESSGRIRARSPKGALGLFQLSPASAKWRAQELGLPEPTEAELLSDPLLNARLGADNLAWLLRTYDGDVERALCAYNAGARRLKELADAAGGWEPWREERERAGTSTILAYAHRVLHYRDELRARGFFAEFYAPEPGEELAPTAPVESGGGLSTAGETGLPVSSSK